MSKQRRRVLMVTGLTLAVTVTALGFLLAVDTYSAGATSVLIGGVTSRELIGICVMSGFLCVSIGLCTVLVKGVWLVLLVPARVAAIIATVLASGYWLYFLAGETVTPIRAHGCETGYVAVERSFLLLSTGEIERRDGAYLTSVGAISGDDGAHPFARGAYTAEYRTEVLHVRYDIHGTQTGVFTAPVDLALPAIEGADRGCTPAAAPPTRALESPRPQPNLSTHALSAEELLAESFVASVPPVSDAQGHPANAADFLSGAAPCAEPGIQRTHQFTFRTGDNAASVAKILDLWTEAGYNADRGVQEDIRYSAVLAVDRMSIKDKTSIDGLIHMTLVTTCPVGE